MQRKRIWLVTGDPGVGKTALISKVIYAVKSNGFTVGGILTKERKEKGERIGFEILDLASMRSGTLASINQREGPRIGKYRVNLKDLAEIGAKAIEYALFNSDLVVCDEIGPMEMFSPELRRAISQLMHSSKVVLGSVHKRLVDPLIEEIKADPNVQVIEITPENMENEQEEITHVILSLLKGS
ncbi:MAG: NTPase [Thaumarchaeota archaeon]|nr:NTPase [Nitrososphaerota archaeon]